MSVNSVARNLEAEAAKEDINASNTEIPKKSNVEDAHTFPRDRLTSEDMNPDASSQPAK